MLEFHLSTLSGHRCESRQYEVSKAEQTRCEWKSFQKAQDAHNGLIEFVMSLRCLIYDLNIDIEANF